MQAYCRLCKTENKYVILWFKLFYNQTSYECASVTNGYMYYNTNKYKKSKCSSNLVTLGSQTKLFILEHSN